MLLCQGAAAWAQDPYPQCHVPHVSRPQAQGAQLRPPRPTRIGPHARLTRPTLSGTVASGSIGRGHGRPCSAPPLKGVPGPRREGGVMSAKERGMLVVLGFASGLLGGALGVRGAEDRSTSPQQPPRARRFGPFPGRTSRPRRPGSGRHVPDCCSHRSSRCVRPRGRGSMTEDRHAEADQDDCGDERQSDAGDGPAGTAHVAARRLWPWVQR